MEAAEQTGRGRKHRLTPSGACVHANIWTCWEPSRVKDFTYGLFRVGKVLQACSVHPGHMGVR